MTRGLFLAGAMVVGCNAIFGVDELKTSVPPEQGGASTAASSTVASTSVSSTAQSGGGGAGDCETCASSMTGCIAERALCAVDPNCLSLSDCLDGCTDSGCRAECLDKNAEGIPALYAQYDCERCTEPCRHLCQPQCDGCGGSDCAACVNSDCVQTACSELWNDCVTSADCVDVVMCMNGCNMDPTCEDICANTHPNGAAILADLVRCAKCSWDTCYEVCDGAMECVP